MTLHEWIGAIAIYLTAWIGGGYIATIVFAVCLDKTRWARTAGLAFCMPVALFGASWLVLGAVAGLILLGVAIA